MKKFYTRKLALKNLSRKIGKVGIGEKIWLENCVVKFRLENWLKPYGILYHKYRLSRLTKLPALPTVTYIRQ